MQRTLDRHGRERQYQLTTATFASYTSPTSSMLSESRLYTYRQPRQQASALFQRICLTFLGIERMVLSPTLRSASIRATHNKNVKLTSYRSPILLRR